MKIIYKSSKSDKEQFQIEFELHNADKKYEALVDFILDRTVANEGDMSAKIALSKIIHDLKR